MPVSRELSDVIFTANDPMPLDEARLNANGRV